MPTRANPRFSFHDSLSAWMFVLFSVPILIGVALLLFWKEVSWFLPLWFICLPLLALTDHEWEIDQAQSLIIHRWKLYRVLLLWKSTETIANYVAVTRRRGGQARGNSPWEQEWIALARPSGKFRYVRYFHVPRSQYCPEAMALAHDLAEATSLPLRDFPDRFFTRQAPHDPIGRGDGPADPCPAHSPMSMAPDRPTTSLPPPPATGLPD